MNDQPSSPPVVRSSDEAARLRALASYHVLDTPPEPSFDRIVALAARSLRAPIAQVSLVDLDRQWVKSSLGNTARETPRDQSFCAHALHSDTVLVIADATLDPRFATNLFVTGEPHVRFYAGAPLVAPRFPGLAPHGREQPGFVRLGTLCVVDTAPRPGGLLPHEEETLRDLAALVVDAFVHRLAAEHQEQEAAGRRRAEAGWRESEERYQRLASNQLGVVHQLARSPEGVYSLPLVGEGCREVLRVSPAAVRQDPQTVFSLILPEDRPQARTSLAESAANLEPWRWEGRFRLPDDDISTVRWLVATSFPQRRPDGTIVWDGILMDVTARHAAEAALRQANRELAARMTERTSALDAEAAEGRRAGEPARASRDLAATLVESATDLVFVKDLRGRYLFVNPAFARAFGKRVEDIVGQESHAIFDAETARHAVARESHVAATGMATVTESPAVPAAGAGLTRVFQTAVSPLRDAAGRVTGTLGISRDITDRQHLERELQVRARQQAAVARLGRRALELDGRDGLDALLTEATALVAQTLEVPFCAVVQRDPEDGSMRHRAVFGWPVEVVGELISSSGANSGAAYLLRHGGAITSPDLLAETRFAPSPEVHRRGLRAAMGVTIARRTEGPADGETAFLGFLSVHDSRVRAWTAEDAAFLQGVANVLAAATDRLRTEEAVKTAQRDAEQANHAKSEFLSRMSHELRTPLNAILGFGQLLELEAGSVGQRESVAHIMRAGRHLLGLIDDVLDIVRLESGRLSLETAPVSVGDVVEEAVSLVRQAAKIRAVDIDGSSGEAGTLRVWADPQRLRQVLVNLLSNAVKYNVPGGRAGLRVRRAEDGRTARLEVWDTGRGIPPELQQRLFRPFERLGAEHAAEEGTGIGLATAHRLVKAMGGSIGVQSAPGKGTTFWVELPAGDEAEYHSRPGVGDRGAAEA